MNECDEIVFSLLIFDSLLEFHLCTFIRKLKAVYGRCISMTNVIVVKCIDLGAEITMFVNVEIGESDVRELKKGVREPLTDWVQLYMVQEGGILIEFNQLHSKLISFLAEKDLKRMDKESDELRCV